jgi:hypothetical protein
MELFDEFFRIVQEFQNRKISYAVVGGIAMAFHDRPRFTKDIDILIHPKDSEKVRTILEGLGYFASAEPWTFKKAKLTLHRFMKIEREDHLVVDVLLGRDDRHKEIIKNALLEKSSGGIVRIASREDIVWMKQCRDSDQDRVDIRKLQNEQD